MDGKNLLSFFRNQRGVSAIGVSIGVATSIAAIGLGLSMMLESSRKSAGRANAKEIAQQLNSTGLEMTMKLISGQAIVQRPDADGVLQWQSKGNSPEWEFVPAVIAGSDVTHPKIVFSVCDPRYANAQDPGNLALCVQDTVRINVNLLPDRDGKHEVQVTTSVSVVRQQASLMETASTRALLSENNLSCPSPLTVNGSAQVIEGSAFTLQLNGFAPATADVFLADGNVPFAGSSPKTLTVSAPKLSPGETVRNITYQAYISSGGGVEQCAPVVVSVLPCKEFATEDPVREVYKSLLVNTSADLADLTMKAEARSIASGAKSILQIQNELRASQLYYARGGVPQTGQTASADLGETVTAMLRVHLNRGGDTPGVATQIVNGSAKLLEYTRKSKAACLYSVASAGGCSNYAGYQFPEYAAALRVTAEFTGANASQYHPEPIEELYKRVLGVGRAELPAAYQAKYDAHLSQIRQGQKAFSAIEAELRADPLYGSRGGASGETFNAIVRTVYGRKPDASELSYYVALSDTYGASRSYIADSLRSSTEFKNLGGCPVPQPAPTCRIVADRDGVKPGEYVRFTLQAYDRLTQVTWDGSNQSISSNGVQVYVKNMLGGQSGTKVTTTATVRNAGGMNSCSIQVPVKNSCSIAVGRRNGGANSRWGPGRFWNNSEWYPYYNHWRVYIPARPDGEFRWSNDTDYSGEGGWEYTGGATPVDSGVWDPCNRASNYPACQKSIKDMPAIWTHPTEGVNYVLSTNKAGVPTPFYPSKGLCGSADCRCWPGQLVSPLVVDLHDRGIQLNAITKFDVGEGKNPHFWPSNPETAYFIAYDKNEDGVIEDIQEIFGNYTTGPDGKTSKGGFEALGKYDENHDGVIDASDQIYAKLKLWADKNLDGVSQPAEIIQMKDVGIKSVDLKYLENDEPNDNYGNISKQRSVVELEDGQLRKVFDIWFAPSGQQPDEKANRELANAK